MGWKPEVMVDGDWSQNSLVFATKEEAAASARELMSRWMLVTDSRAIEVDKPATYAWVDGQLKGLA